MFSGSMKKKTTEAPSRIRDNVAAGSLLELSVTRLDDDGYGIADFNGRNVKVTGAFPGESVRARITHVGKESISARTMGLTRPSHLKRVALPSKLCETCANCTLMALDYASQLLVKLELVRGCLAAHRSLGEVAVNEVIASPRQLCSRTTAKLAVGGTFRTPRIGIYRRHSHEVIDIGSCPLHHPLINTIVAAVKEGIRRGKVHVYSPETGSGLLRYLVIRVSEDGSQAMVVFVSAYRSYNELHHLARHLQTAVPQVVVIAQNENPSSGNVILGERFHFYTPQHSLTARIGEINLAVSPRSFFQVNTGSAQIIYEKVAEWGMLTGKERVIDVYCGIGGIALYLAGRAEEITGIEAVEAAVSDAEKNARLNGTRNCRFVAGDAGELLAEMREDNVTVDLVVINPPRKGCERRALDEIGKLKPARIIYVSCSPWTLARDLDILSRVGYRTREVQPVDMFPQTPHIENIALLTRV